MPIADVRRPCVTRPHASPGDGIHRRAPGL